MAENLIAEWNAQLQKCLQEVERKRVSADRRSRLEEWIRLDERTMRLLHSVRELAPAGSYIAAGAIRNLVWDRLHGYGERTPLHDVDVIYFDASDTSPESETITESRLRARCPDAVWQVRNQARMHARNGDAPYGSAERAMQAWPETATAVGVRLADEDKLELICPWGLDDLFELRLRPSLLCRDTDAFGARVREKQWGVLWPKLLVDIS